MFQKLNNHVIIMAAGRGLRMKPLTDSIPKAMAPIKGSTLIANGINQLSKNFNNIHITVGYKGALLARHVIDLKVNTIFNTNNKGNSWWLYNTLIKSIDAPIFVLTCDNIFEINFKSYLDDYYYNKSPACMILPVNPIKGLDGDYIIENDKNVITEITRKKKSEYYCSGLQILNPFKINKITKSCENFQDVWKQLIVLNEIKKSNLILKKWYAVDTLTQLNNLN